MGGGGVRGTKGEEPFTGMAQGINSQMTQQKICLSWDPDFNLLFAQATAQPSLAILESR